MPKLTAQTPILTTQRNAVFHLIQGHKFDPGDFEWQVAASPIRPGDTIDYLVHVPSGYGFAFEYNTIRLSYDPEDRMSMFSPGPDSPRVTALTAGWVGQMEHVEVWLRSLTREVSTVSLWDTFGREPTRELASANLSNNQLNKEQRQEIEARVAKVRAYLRNNVDDRARLTRVEKKLDELVDASKRLGKRDFANVALGLLMTIAVEAALDPDKAQHVVNLFFTGVHALLGN
jgi:hypothetical protein